MHKYKSGMVKKVLSAKCKTMEERRKIYENKCESYLPTGKRRWKKRFGRYASLHATALAVIYCLHVARCSAYDHLQVYSHGRDLDRL